MGDGHQTVWHIRGSDPIKAEKGNGDVAFTAIERDGDISPSKIPGQRISQPLEEEKGRSGRFAGIVRKVKHMKVFGHSPPAASKSEKGKAKAKVKVKVKKGEWKER